MHCAKTFRRLHGTRTIAAKAPRRCTPSRKHPLATPSGRALASGSAACLEHLRAIVAGIVSRRPSRRRCCRRLPPLALLGHSVLHPAAANTMAPSEAVVQTVGILGGAWGLWQLRFSAASCSACAPWTRGLFRSSHASCSAKVTFPCLIPFAICSASLPPQVSS